MEKFGINNESTIENAKGSLLSLFSDLLNESYNHNLNVPWLGVHDEGTYLTAFREYFLHTKDPKVKDYAFRLLDQAYSWANTNFVHGYYPKHEVHHGIENFVIFYAWLYELDPTNDKLRALINNAAENILHAPNNIKWFDLDANRFTSMYLGTEFVNLKMNLNIAEHLRIIRLAWLSLALGGSTELKQVINNYLKEWVEIINTLEPLPIFLPQQNSTSNDIEHFQKALKKFIGAAPKTITNITRSEFHIANGTPDLFLAMYENSHEKIYLDAVERILSPLMNQLNSPYAHPLGEIFWRIYQMGRFPELLSQITPIKHGIDAFIHDEFRLHISNQTFWNRRKYQNTVGFRRDMPFIYCKSLKSGKNTSIPSPSTFGLLFRLTENPEYLIFGLQYAHAVLLEARKSYPEGRKHGCSSRMLHSFCIGNGRDWGSGFTSTILRAALDKKCYNIYLPKIQI